ncbi:F-box only protein 9 isoform X2 [Phycodurus eques]|uniref:F-box only protein 9 isoform X2 n=1 Tax=Phycodurus eques TaxID=693459 RepID=UPI002ACE9EDB|nr:F-box only protein 9 isoform X2 [Phycodurus eques]
MQRRTFVKRHAHTKSDFLGQVVMAEENVDIGGTLEEEDDRSDEPNLELQLNAFRSKWMSELKPSCDTRLLRAMGQRRTQEIARQEKAVELYLRAVQEEQNGAFYEAIKFYRMAMQLVPDIESKINYSHPDAAQAEGNYREEKDADGEIEDLVAYFEQQLTLGTSFTKICSPELEKSQVHISGTLRFGVQPVKECGDATAPSSDTSCPGERCSCRGPVSVSMASTSAGRRTFVKESNLWMASTGLGTMSTSTGTCASSLMAACSCSPHLRSLSLLPLAYALKTSDWMLSSSATSVCPRRPTIKPKFMLLSARERRRNRQRCKRVGSAGGTLPLRLSKPSTWDSFCPLGGVRVSISWHGYTTPATSLTS